MTAWDITGGTGDYSAMASYARELPGDDDGLGVDGDTSGVSQDCADGRHGLCAGCPDCGCHVAGDDFTTSTADY